MQCRRCYSVLWANDRDRARAGRTRFVCGRHPLRGSCFTVNCTGTTLNPNELGVTIEAAGLLPGRLLLWIMDLTSS